MRDHYSLVPGSGTTTLLLNVTQQRYAAQFSYLGYKLHTFPFDGLTYRVSSDSIAGVTDNRAHKLLHETSSVRLVLRIIKCSARVWSVRRVHPRARRARRGREGQ